MASRKKDININRYDEIYLEYFHQFTKGRGVRVAVLDSEIDLSHIEFKGANIVSREFVENLRTDYHGTAVTSLIVGRTIGVAPEAEVHHLKILSDIESDGPAWANAMHYVLSNDIDIVCMSIGTKRKLSLGMQKHLQDARYKGITVVAPSGNEGMHVTRYPAGDKNVIAVGGLNAEGRVSSQSNTPTGVDLSALSEDVLVANIDDKVKYFKKTGTSFSNAIVAGQLALIKAYARDNGVELDVFEFIKKHRSPNSMLDMRNIKEILDSKYGL